VGDKPGTCFGNACVLPVCGDGRVDASLEHCDDGNTAGGDGCSADCQSNEVCGNGVVDLITGEECDDGNLELSGDGCSATCKREYRLWRDVSSAGPPFRAGYGLVTDPDHGVLMFGGGTYGAATPYDIERAKFADTWRWDGSTWIDEHPIVSPPRRSHPALAYDLRRSRVVLFGGFNQNGNATADTWEWDGVTWRDRTPPTMVSGPHARSGAAFACTDTECVMFGGAKNLGVTYHVDTWIWDGTSWTENTTSTSNPSGRRSAQLAYDPVARRLVLFGGETTLGAITTELFDTWTYEAGQWTLRSILGPHPTQTPTLAWDDAAKQMVLFAQGNTWRLDATFTWLPLEAPPDNIQYPVIAWDKENGQLLAVGQDLLTSTMAMSRRAMGWFAASDLHPSSGGGGTPAAYDAHRGVTVVFDPLLGTFEWNGVGYRLTVPIGSAMVPTGPSGLEGALAHHLACRVTVSFGGHIASGVKTDETWRYGVGPTSAPSWTRITGTLPAPRIQHAMTYDPVRDVVLMFGGRINGGLSNDLWQLTSPGCAPTGWAWTQLGIGQAIVPPPRAGAAMAFDDKRGVSVLFGGRDPSAVELGDTWDWNGSVWTERLAKASPPARGDHAMAYDPRRGRVVMFGGRVEGTLLDDAWEWDGVAGTWLELAPAALPAARADHALAMDVTGGLLAVGGDSVGGQIPDLRLSSELSTVPRESCTDATLDLDGDGLRGCADPDCWTRCAPTCAPGTSCTDRCGDHTCNAPLEDYVICPEDCTPP
jgi:cysteine-rich repeat protein